MLSCVRIPPQAGSSIGFDLTDVVVAVGDQSHLAWEIAGVVALAPKPPYGELWTCRQPDALVTWSALSAFAETWLQVIDGEFTGRQWDGSVELMISAVDSSFWTVAARDSAVLARIRESFERVVDVTPDES